MFYFKPFKKERSRGGSTGSTGLTSHLSGHSPHNGSSNMFRFMNKRKKSAPEQEIKRLYGDHYYHDDRLESICSAASGNLITSTDIHHSRVSLNSSNNLTTTYNIYLNESCSVEVTASQHASTAQNILNMVSYKSKEILAFNILEYFKQVLQKIKVAGDFLEYCLVEHLEFEQGTTKQVSINVSTPSIPQSTAAHQSNSVTNLNNVSSPSTSMIHHNNNLTTGACKQQPQNYKSVMKKRILGPNENLFVLTHVWNKMREDKKDGFKCAKIILTKRKEMLKLHDASYLKKQSSLAKHRMSLQPTTTNSTPSGRSMLLNIIGNNGNSHRNHHGESGGFARPLAQRVLALTQKRTKSSLHRLVRQKSFEESLEDVAMMSQHYHHVDPKKDLKNIVDPTAFAATTTVTTTTDDILLDDSTCERKMSGKKVTEVVESTLAVSTEILVQKDETVMPKIRKNSSHDSHKLSMHSLCGMSKSSLSKHTPPPQPSPTPQKEENSSENDQEENEKKEAYEMQSMGSRGSRGTMAAASSLLSWSSQKLQKGGSLGQQNVKGRCYSDGENKGAKSTASNKKQPPLRQLTLQRFFKLKF